MKKVILTIVIVLLCSTVLNAQNHAVDKGAKVFMGMASYASLGGEYMDNRYNIISLTPMVNYFLVPHIFLGVGISYTRQSQGDDSRSEIGIGPNIGYAAGNRNSKTYPYLALGVRYRSERYDSESASGSAIILAAGLLYPVKQHIGIIFEASYHIMSTSYDGSSVSTNLITVGVGIAGLLY